MPTPSYHAPFWLPGAHLQTIIPAQFSRIPAPVCRRERWDTPDGDFIDLDWVEPLPHAVPDTRVAPLLVIFHGLEGNADSPYARALMRAAQARGWVAVLPHFRSCSGEINRAPRFYHSGDAAEIDWILRRLAAQHGGPLCAAGISLGGNALLRWLGEQGHTASQWLSGAAAVSAPLDLHAGGRALAKGFNRIYTRHFLQTLKKKSLLKLQQYPGLFDRHAMLAAGDLHTFDNIVTAPLHGFRDADDYWTRASSKPILRQIRVPTLVLNARNDPFLPARALPDARQAGSYVVLEQPATGGHVGFPTSWAVRRSGTDSWLAQRLTGFLNDSLNRV